MDVILEQRKEESPPSKVNLHDEKLVSDKKKSLTEFKSILLGINERFNFHTRFRSLFLTFSLAYLLTLNQFFIQIRFLLYINDVFFQLIMPAFITLLVIYWADELESIVYITFGGWLFFIFGYLFVVNFPWLLGFITSGAATTIFANIAIFIRILPMLTVMMLLGASLAAIIKSLAD